MGGRIRGLRSWILFDPDLLDALRAVIYAYSTRSGAKCPHMRPTGTSSACFCQAKWCHAPAVVDLWWYISEDDDEVALHERSCRHPMHHHALRRGASKMAWFIMCGAWSGRLVAIGSMNMARPLPSL